MGYAKQMMMEEMERQQREDDAEFTEENPDLVAEFGVETARALLWAMGKDD